MPNARVIVCGSRDWHDRKIIADNLNRLVEERSWRFPNPVVVHGAARGADRLAADEAGKAGFLVEAHPADWNQHGKAAGFIRNEEMAKPGANLCLAFWDGKSKGTLHMMDTARRHGIDVRIVFKEES